MQILTSFVTSLHKMHVVCDRM